MCFGCSVGVVISRYGLAVVVGERVIEASLVKDRRRTVSRSVNRGFNSFFGHSPNSAFVNIHALLYTTGMCIYALIIIIKKRT